MLARAFVHPGAFRRGSGWHVTSVDEEADVRRLGFQQPVCVAPNGVDAPVDDPNATRTVLERIAPEIAGKRVLLFYSRFHSKKGVLDLIRTFSATPRTPDWHLLIVGIPEEYSVARLRAEADTLGLSEAVSVVDGRALPAPYAVAELMALPSLSENFGQVVAEALAHGIAVITTTATPWDGLNVHRAGACVELNAFQEALGSWMGLSKGELRDAGERGRRWVLAEFSWDASASRLVAFYEALISHAARPGSA